MAKLNTFSASLLQSSVALDPSETLNALKCWFDSQETFYYYYYYYHCWKEFCCLLFWCKKNYTFHDLMNKRVAFIWNGNILCVSVCVYIYIYIYIYIYKWLQTFVKFSLSSLFTPGLQNGSYWWSISWVASDQCGAMRSSAFKVLSVLTGNEATTWSQIFNSGWSAHQLSNQFNDA